MKCPKCDYEPRDRLLHRPCEKCGHVWVDTESYVYELTMRDEWAPRIDRPKTVLDIGCGNKGVIAQHHWEHVVGIERGYACDRHVVKELPPLWTPLVTDAAKLMDVIGVDSVDFTTHCGMLEHVDYRHALDILIAIELVTSGRVFFTCSAIIREVDYKVRRDGNPYHYYKSFWDPTCFELLGYHVDLQRMRARQTFTEEITGWFDVNSVRYRDTRPWEERMRPVLTHIRDRRCAHEGCNHEPVGWHVDDGIFCLQHRPEKDIAKGPIERWLRNPDRLGEFPYPPGRAPLALVGGS